MTFNLHKLGQKRGHGKAVRVSKHQENDRAAFGSDALD